MANVVMPLDKVWGDSDYHHFIQVIGFASGMMDENASAETKELYKQAAVMCEAFISTYNKKIGK